MSASERVLRNQLYWSARGRADCLLILARHLGWSTEYVDLLAEEMLSLPRKDLAAARDRQNAYAE